MGKNACVTRKMRETWCLWVVNQISNRRLRSDEYALASNIASVKDMSIVTQQGWETVQIFKSLNGHNFLTVCPIYLL